MSDDIIDQLWDIENQRKQKSRPKQLPPDGTVHTVDDTNQTYIIKTRQYCGLSRDTKWQKWLGDIAPDLLLELRNLLETSQSCKKNTQKMKEIQDKLAERGKLKELVYFLRDEHPQVLVVQSP